MEAVFQQVMPIKSPELAHILQQQKSLTVEQISSSSEAANRTQTPLLHYLIEEKILPAKIIAKNCADYFGFQTVDLYEQINDLIIPQDIPLKFLKQYAFIPIKQNLLAISDPTSISLLNELKFQNNIEYQIVFAPHDQFNTFINKLVSKQVYLNATQPQTNIIELVNHIITDAIYQKASDIHFEPIAEGYRIRMRIDGILHNIAKLPNTQSAAINSRLKILADLDISEKRLPQDGRFNFITITKIGRDCRLSSCPTLFGEKIVVRLLNPSKKILNFNQLGLEKKTQTNNY